MDDIKRLYRSDDAMLAGVCAGIAEYFGFDPTIARIFAVILLVMLLGTPAIVYAALIFIVPKEPLGASRPIDIKASASGEISAIGNRQRAPGAAWVSSNSEAFDAVDPDSGGADGKRTARGMSTATTLGVLLVGFGAIALMGLFIDPFFFSYWPLIIILVGMLTLFTPGYSGWRVSRAGYSILVITVGAVLQLWRLGTFGLAALVNTFWTFWPAGLIAMGLLIVGGSLRRDIFKLMASLLVALALVVGVWSFGQMGGSYYISLPFVEKVNIELPRSPFPLR